MDKDKEMEVKKDGAIALRVSGDKNMPAGFEGGDDQTDLKMARIAILQGLSQICIDGKAKMGQIANSLTQELLPDTVEFIPLFLLKTRARFEAGRGLVMMSRDNETVTMAIEEFSEYLGKPVEEVPGIEWDGDNPPTFSLVYNYLSLLVGRLTEFPLSLSLMKTATKAAKELYSMARYTGEDMFARVYSLKTRIEKGEKGTYAVPVIELVRRCTDEEYAIAKKFFDLLYRRKKDIDVELEEEPTADKNE